jgi:hypothetical protein
MDMFVHNHLAQVKQAVTKLSLASSSWTRKHHRPPPVSELLDSELPYQYVLRVSTVSECYKRSTQVISRTLAGYSLMGAAFACGRRAPLPAPAAAAALVRQDSSRQAARLRWKRAFVQVKDLLRRRRQWSDLGKVFQKYRFLGNHVVRHKGILVHCK